MAERHTLLQTASPAMKRMLRERDQATRNRLSDNELLLNTFEYGALCVANGADPDTDEFAGYAEGKRLILERMVMGRIDPEDNDA